MGQRTGWRRARPEGVRREARARTAAVGAVLSVSAALAAAPAAAAGPAAPTSYGFATGAETIKGAKGTTDAGLLEPGRSYRSSLSKGAKLYYRIEPDASSNAYVSVTAVPRAGGKVSLTDGIHVSVQNADGSSCSFQSAIFGAAGSPHPITAWGARTTSPPTPVCEGGGPYYVVVERVDAAGSASGAWDLELTTMTEPRLAKSGPTSAPSTWDSATPTPLTGEAKVREGGAGFARAASVDQGVWRAGISPGQTLFYKVPVDWGQQPSAVAELGSSDGTVTAGGYTVGALELALYNPVRADVEDVSIGYDGSQKTAELAPVPAVAYANRYAATDRVNGMRFAGWYYIAVHLSAAVADDFGRGPFGLTLRVRVAGAAQDGPGYAGQPVPHDVFGVTAKDRQTAAEGGAGGGTAMKVVAAGGIGAGTVVLVVLGVWTAAGRRRVRGW
ncbi:hypothetical protein ACIRVK_20920 [Streptomyces sp. NPDC101152]|uniref:hypothetical protein n=1 Tax=Streptomyces sp. NPDC101152 TaxID=3366116 RepID=UPI00380598B0